MLDSILDVVLAVHVIAGFAALGAAVLATAVKLFDGPHNWHVWSGKVFVFGMAGIVVTAIPVALARSNHTLLWIAVFSGYVAFAGWRYAKNRSGTATGLDWARLAILALVSIMLIVIGGWSLRSGNTIGVVLLVFAGIGGGLCCFEAKTLRAGGATGRTRVTYHLTMMLSGLIATVTAFVVVNFTVKPAFVLWLVPSVLITPLIVWWNVRIQAGQKPRGMP